MEPSELDAVMPWVRSLSTPSRVSNAHRSNLNGFINSHVAKMITKYDDNAFCMSCPLGCDINVERLKNITRRVIEATPSANVIGDASEKTGFNSHV